MSRLLLKDLLPATKYKIQVRAVNDQVKSKWSQVFPITTISKSAAPADVTGLTWTTVGTSFLGTWNKSVEGDGKQAKDFKAYIVTITDGTSQGQWVIASTRFEFTLEMNRSTFGTPKPTLKITVQCVDTSGNISVGVSSAFVSNAAPAPPTNVHVYPMQDAVQVTYTPSVSTDIDHYVVYSVASATATSGGTALWTGRATNVVVPDTTYTLQYFSVAAVDVFGQETRSATPNPSATPNSIFVTDTTPPPSPATVTTSGEGINTADPSGITRQVTVNWTLSAGQPTDLAGFYVTYKRATDTNWTTLDVQNPATTSQLIQGLAPATTYNIRVQAYDYTKNASGATGATDVTTGSNTTPPSQPTAPVVAANAMQIQVSISGTKQTGGAMEGFVAYYEVYLYQTSGQSLTGVVPTGTINVNAAMVNTFPVPANASSGTNQTWYGKIRAISGAGISSPYSNESNASVPLISSSNIQDATITNAKIHDLAADKITAGTGLINDLTVKATLTLGQAGTLGAVKSYDFASGLTGFNLASTGLEINQGVIRAPVLQIQDSVNVMPSQYADFELTSTYYSSVSSPVFVLNNATVSADASHVFRGTQALKVVSGGLSGTVDFTPSTTTYPIPVQGGQTYIFSCYTWSSAVANLSLRMQDNSTGALTGAAMNASTAGAFSRVTATLTVPNNATAIWVGLGFNAAGTIWVDAMQLEAKIAGSSAPSPWRPPSLTVIDGGMIKTGSIQSTALAAFGDTTQPAWAINVNGAAAFNDVSVRGRITIGNSGSANNSLISIQSYNYVTGSTGWAITGAGNAEFNNGTFRGTMKTAVSGRRWEISSTFIDSLVAYSGSSSETAAGFVQVGVTVSPNGYDQGTLYIRSPRVLTPIATYAAIQLTSEDAQSANPWPSQAKFMADSFIFDSPTGSSWIPTVTFNGDISMGSNRAIYDSSGNPYPKYGSSIQRTIRGAAVNVTVDSSSSGRAYLDTGLGIVPVSVTVNGNGGNYGINVNNLNPSGKSAGTVELALRNVNGGGLVANGTVAPITFIAIG